jgi:NAD(P)-dependent dehydrogenase (short-subunit alcohol dehydrogenase family)
MSRDELMAIHHLTGKTFMVTEGTGVLGGEVAGTLVNVGGDVVVLDRSQEPKQGLTYCTSQRGGRRTQPVGGDVLNRTGLDEVVAVVMAAPSTASHPAGGNNPKATVSSTMSSFDISEEGMRFVFDLNLLGTIIPSQVFAKRMAERSKGVIMNYSSMERVLLLTDIAAYSASGAGMIDFTAWLTVHMAQYYSGKMRVNAIALASSWVSGTAVC